MPKPAVPLMPAEPVPITIKWQTAKDMAAKVTVDLEREVDAKCSRSSKTRGLSAIEPVRGSKCASIVVPSSVRRPRIKSQSGAVFREFRGRFAP